MAYEITALVAINLHVGLMLVYVDEELRHFRMQRAVCSQPVVEMSLYGPRSKHDYDCLLSH